MKQSIIPTLAVSMLLVTSAFAGAKTTQTNSSGQQLHTSKNCTTTPGAKGTVKYSCHNKMVDSQGKTVMEENVVGKVQQPKKVKAGSSGLCGMGITTYWTGSDC